MQLININKKYGEKVIFENFSYEFKQNKITVVIGDSGVGKTTLLNIILGLTDFDGEINQLGKLSCVFQNDRLIPTLTVRENLELICKDIDVEAELDKLELLDAIDYYPSKLSAGMARRVAVVRALNFDADAVLMDEPFSGLDFYMKYRMVDEIKNFQTKTNSTIIIITHDLKIASTLADYVLVLKNNHKFVEITNSEKNTEDKLLKILIKK